MPVYPDIIQRGPTGFSREEYAKRHHGGYLGQKSRTGHE